MKRGIMDLLALERQADYLTHAVPDPDGGHAARIAEGRSCKTIRLGEQDFAGPECNRVEIEPDVIRHSAISCFEQAETLTGTASSLR
jgi:hypothetical protein